MIEILLLTRGRQINQKDYNFCARNIRNIYGTYIRNIQCFPAKILAFAELKKIVTHSSRPLVIDEDVLSSNECNFRDVYGQRTILLMA